MLKMTNIKFKK